MAGQWPFTTLRGVNNRQTVNLICLEEVTRKTNRQLTVTAT